ncbi:hypothetical protein V6N11_065501 [Hibiscus sabdariffa]|uniref:Uncharacterized protein n=1 Tax=Hibiscus sabdariffa TaxID=183260 RepID=A0ABR2PHH4_9ROSI
MAKQTPSPLKRRKAPSFSETEMDVARQLMQLCRKHSGDRGSKKAKQADETNPWNRYALEDEEHKEEEEERIRSRKRRFKSIDFIYRITVPLIIQDHQNVKKMKMKMMCN